MPVEQHIETLQKRRDALKLQIHSELSHPSADDMRVYQLKRENLELKDEIVRLLRRSDGDGGRVAA